MAVPMQISRREMLGLSGFGLGQIAAADLLGGAQLLAEDSPHNVPVFGNLRARRTHFPPQAKAVIQLVQNGGPSQMDLFDPKPVLNRMDGKPFPGNVEEIGNQNTPAVSA